MKTPKMNLVETRGNGDLKTLQADARETYEQADANGTLRVMHPVTGRVMPGKQYADEVEARKALHLKSSEFWRVALNHVGETALNGVESTANHQEIATLEDKRQEMQTIYPYDRHIVGVDVD